MRRRRLALFALGFVAVLAVACFAFAGPLARGALSAGARAAGYDLQYGELRNRDGRLTMTDAVVAATGREPLLRVGRIDVAYDLGRLFGGPYLFGISAIELDRPQVTIVHYKDGTYNFSLPASNGRSSAPQAIPKIRVIVRDGSAGVIDATRIFAHSRRLALGDVEIEADVDPAAISHFAFRVALTEDGGTFPVSGRGTLDEARGYEMSRVHARALGLGPLIDYALNSTSLHVSNGVLNDVDARIYGLPDARGTMQRHVSVTANLDHFQPYLNGIAKPLRDGRGSLRVYDDGLTFPKIDGSIADVPIRIAGGIYGLSKPFLRLGIVGHGDLRELLSLNDAAKKLPASGPVAFTLFVEGDATQPTTLATFRSPRVSYAHIPIDAPAGFVALHGQDTSILRTSLGYNGATLGARGNLHVEAKHTGVDLFASVAAPLGRFPYAAAFFGPMLLHADTVLSGVDANAIATGTLEGATGATRLAATFSVAGNGVGTIGPLALNGPGARELYARVVLDRPKGAGGAAFVSARDFTFATGGKQPQLPGLALPAVPEVSGTLDAAFAGAFSGKRFTLGGDAHGYGIRALGYPVDDLTARVAARDGSRVAVEARYRGALAPLARAAGGRVVASGDADVPVALVASGTNDIVAQIRDARLRDARVGGITVDGIEGTARIRGRTIDVYGARATLDGHDVVARGTFGNGGTLEVSASGVELASLRSLRLPVIRGDVSAIAAIDGPAASPHVEGGVAASDVRLAAPQVASLPLDGSAGLTYDAGTLSVHDALVRAGSAVGSLDGKIAGLHGDPKGATYEFDAHVRQADIATLARIAHADRHYPEGSLEADVTFTGSGLTPRARGRIAIPEGSINGLRFRNATVALSGGATAIAVRDGRVTVGNSTLGFDADLTRSTQRLALRAPKIDLADFNDYFDAGDTLGGAGSIALSAKNEPNAVVTSGRIRLAHTRFRDFDVGDSRADWSTSGRTVRTNLTVGGSAGRITEDGTILLPASQPLRDALHRTSLALVARATSVDLKTWLPVFDVRAPVTGLVNAGATIRGSYPSIVVAAHAEVRDGTAGPVAIRTATLDARAANGRATVTNALLAIDNLTVGLTGSAGMEPRTPFDFTVVARTADVGALAKTLTAKSYDVAGTVTTTARITGTAARPLVTTTLDARQLRYAKYVVPSAHAVLAVTKTGANLSAAEVDLQSGRLLADGHASLATTPALGIGPPGAPIAFDLTAQRIDFAQFAPLLPKGTQLAGLLDGKVGLVGSLANPGLTGTLALSDGSFVGPQEKSKIVDLVSELTFNDRSVTLHDTSAKIGGGAISADGSLTVPDLTDPAATTSGNLTLRSNGAVFDVPALFKGRIDGTVALKRAAHQNASVTGNLAVTSARIPTTALVPKAAGAQTSATPLPVSLALAVNVGNDVRVQGGPVDIGAKGDLSVGGTLGSPTVSGELDSTGGTLSLYRTFDIQYPTTVSFDGTGVIPYVDANATTSVDNPPTDVSVHVTGPATQLNVAFASNPSYSRDQIVGILVGLQSLGAVSGLQPAPGPGTPQQNPFTSVAEGQLGSLLTQNIFEPLSSQVGSAVGLSNLALSYTPGGGASVGAQKRIFKNLSAVFAESFSYPQRQSIGLLASPNKTTAAQLTFFSQPQSNRFDTFEGALSLNSTNDAVTDSEPANGSSGFSFSLQRKF